MSIEQTEPWRLSGSVVVTGASSGIGAAIVQRLAERGARVVLTGRDRGALDRLTSELRSSGHDAEAEFLDVTDEGGIEELAEKIASRGDFAGWVNNSGINEREPLVNLTTEQFEKVLRVNMLGYFLGTRAAGRRLTPGGAIVNVSSISGRIAFSHNAHYGASKGAIDSFTRHAAVDLADAGIRVNAVSPGSIRTRMTEARLADPAALEDRLRRIPLRRIGTPEDVAGPVAFLCSPEAAYITGTTVVVDGGWTAS